MTEQIVFAEEILRKMLLFMGFSHSIEIKKRDDNIMLCIEGCDDASRLIGKDGHVLDSIQILLNVIIYKKLQERSSTIIDVDGYREHRQQRLKQQAQKAANEAISSGNPAVLEPMTALERRIVHLELADNEAVTTESIDHNPATGLKRVQISPKE